MKIKVEIDSNELFTFREIAEIIAEQNGLSVDSVEGKTAIFSNPDNELYGYSRYRVDLKTGYTECEDNPGEWSVSDVDFDCPIRDDWSEVVFATGEDGKTYAIR